MTRPPSRSRREFMATGAVAVVGMAATEGEPPRPRRGILDRWPMDGGPTRGPFDLGLMDREEWAAIPDGERPPGRPGADRRFVLCEIPSGGPR